MVDDFIKYRGSTSQQVRGGPNDVTFGINFSPLQGEQCSVAQGTAGSTTQAAGSTTQAARFVRVGATCRGNSLERDCSGAPRRVLLRSLLSLSQRHESVQ